MVDKLEDSLQEIKYSLRESARVDGLVLTQIEHYRKELNEIRKAQEEHLISAEAAKSDIFNRLKYLEEKASENAGKIAEWEREELAMIKAANAALVEKDKEATKFRRAFVIAVLPVGGAVLGGIGYLLKLFLDWWAGNKQ